jgi:CelD/BcsL family acetyltransferase involved in cellulose biosynthesis
VKVNITLYESDALFAELEGEWRELLSDSAADQIFMTREWLSTWWEAYQPGRIWTLVARDAEGRCQGIAPWFVTVVPGGQRVIRSIGYVDVTDYMDVIARRGAEQAVFAALAGWLAGHSGTFDRIELRNFPEDSPALAQLPNLLSARGLDAQIQLDDVCPVITLPERFEDYVASLDKKNRHELRRKLRRAAGQMDWYIAGPEHDLSAELGVFLRLMAASSPEKTTFLDDAKNRTFFELVVPKIAERGWLQLAVLTINGDAAAAYLNFDYGNRILVYNSGHDPAAYGQMSGGIVLMARLIEHAIERRRLVFDFLRGDEPYKYDLGGHDTKIYRMEIAGGRRP